MVAWALSIVLIFLAGLPPAVAAGPPHDNVVDRTHAAASRIVGDVADRLDRFFVDENIDQANNATRLRIGGGIEVIDAEGIGFEQRFRLDLRLPRTSRRLALVLVGADADDPLIDSISTDGDEDDAFAGFLRYFLLDRRDAWLSVDGGMRFRPEPDPFVRLRGTRTIPVGSLFSLTPRQTLFYELEDGVGETTRIDLDRWLSTLSLLRLRAQATWSEVSSGVDLESALSYSRKLTALSGIRLSATVFGRTEPSARATNYVAAVRYRWAVWKDWLFAEIEPEARFPRDRSWRINPGVTVRLEVILGRRRIAAFP